MKRYRPGNPQPLVGTDTAVVYYIIADITANSETDTTDDSGVDMKSSVCIIARPANPMSEAAVQEPGNSESPGK